MSTTTKRYLISTGLSFATGFLIAITPYLEGLTVNGLTKSFLVGVLFAGIRGGAKALVEYITAYMAASKANVPPSVDNMD